LPALRHPGMYGRQPLDRAKPRPILERYLDAAAPLSAAGLPAVTLHQDVDRCSKVLNWPMYLNNQIGDCTIAAIGHMHGAWSQYASGTEVMFTDSQIQTVYSRVGGYVPGQPATDQGCQMSDVLADQARNGMVDVTGKTHKIVAYASFGNPANEVLLGQVLDVFGSVYVGFNVQQVIEDEFSNNGVWTYAPGQPFIGGHAVCLQRRVPAGSKHGILQYVSWGALTWADFGWQANTVEEAWAVVTESWLQANGTTVTGLNLQQLLADTKDV
jgi:hypothetical protein